METPLEYGDNFPVPSSGSWNPSVPWRFPHHEMFSKKPPSLLGRIFPWITLGLGISLGILWMSWWLDLPLPQVGDQTKETTGESMEGVQRVLPGPPPLKEPGKKAPERRKPAKSAQSMV